MTQNSATFGHCDVKKLRTLREIMGHVLLVGMALALTCTPGIALAQTTTYTTGTPISAAFVSPTPNDQFADSSFNPATIVLAIRFSDYDSVTYSSADGSRSFSNAERGIDKNPDGTARYTVRMEKILADGSSVLIPSIGPQPSRTAG
jgi:hypothetical protein